MQIRHRWAFSYCPLFQVSRQKNFSLHASLLGDVPNLEAMWRLKFQSTYQPTSVQAI